MRFVTLPSLNEDIQYRQRYLLEYNEKGGENLDIARAIYNLRVNKEWSQQELADKLFVSRDLVSKWETRQRRPDWQTIEKIAEIFCVQTSVIADKNELLFLELERCLPDNSDLTTDELATMLNSFLYGVDEREANIFIRRYYLLESTADIAIVFRLKENHIRSTLSRTRKKLKRYIKEVINEQHKNV